MNFNNQEIKFSNNDLKANLKIPEILTKELAEFIGIIVGDGHIGLYGCHKQIVITGNIRDTDYYKNYVNNLIFKVFNIKFNLNFQKSRNAVILRKESKALFYFLNEIIGLPTRKDSIQIPGCILKGSKEEKISFLKGLADADFCLTIKYKPKKYPVICGVSKSEFLIKQVKCLLDQLEISNCYIKESSYYAKRDKTYVTYRIYINGYKNTEKWLNFIGFSNKRTIDKYDEIKK